MSWETIRTICWGSAAAISLGMFIAAELELRRVRRKLAKSESDLGISRQDQAAVRQHCNDMKDAALLHGDKVREGISKEIGHAIDTLDACKALTDRERDILMAVSYHYSPVEPELKLLSGRILEQLTIQELVGR